MDKSLLIEELIFLYSKCLRRFGVKGLRVYENSKNRVLRITINFVLSGDSCGKVDVLHSWSGGVFFICLLLSVVSFRDDFFLLEIFQYQHYANEKAQLCWYCQWRSFTFQFCNLKTQLISPNVCIETLFRSINLLVASHYDKWIGITFILETAWFIMIIIKIVII